MPTPGPYIKFTQYPANTIVRVENISKHTSSDEAVALFNTLVGDVKTFQDFRDSPGDYIDITFFSEVAATKALCMAGYVIHGSSLVVNLAKPSQTKSRIKNQPDDRRNLYVLGLPFALTKSEFSGLFSQYGTVSHCVILATVDNSSRRRGFVVMSSHEEARLAMASLTRTHIKGHVLDISWAVVQRSQGFLDGGDRTMATDLRVSHSTSTLPDAPKPTSSADSSSSSISHETDIASLSPSLVPTPMLLVSNLPTFLFSQTQDMHPLFYPFGCIKKLEIVDSFSPGTTSVVLEYVSADIAQDAKETLHGQCYAGHRICARYVRSKSSLSSLAALSNAAFHDINAPSYARQSYTSRPTHLAHDSMSLQRFTASRHTSLGSQNAHHATHPNLSHYHSRNASRPGSASSRWSARSTYGEHSTSSNYTVNTYQRYSSSSNT